MSVVPSDSRYVPLVMQDFCAIPACISMVMLRRNLLPLVPQELLAHHLGLLLPKASSHLVFNARTCAVGEEGRLQTHEGRFQPSLALSTLGISLRFQFVPVSEMDAGHLHYLLAELSSKEDDRDVLFRFDRHILDDKSCAPNHPNDAATAERRQQQHMCVLDQLISEGTEEYTIRVVDPAVDAPKWRTVGLARLLRAMQALDEEGGLWLLSGLDDYNSDHYDQQDIPTSDVAPPKGVPPALSCTPPLSAPGDVETAQTQDRTSSAFPKSHSDEGMAWGGADTPWKFPRKGSAHSQADMFGEDIGVLPSLKALFCAFAFVCTYVLYTQEMWQTSKT